jgi:hypothetical protein
VSGTIVRDRPGWAREANDVLLRLGLGRLPLSARPSTFPGRNENWAGTTEYEIGVFVKRFGGPPSASLRQLRRSLAFWQVPATVGAVPAPRLLGYDEPARLLVSELITGAVTGAELAATGAFGKDLATRAGLALARLHGAAAPDPLPGCSPGDRLPALPSAELLHGLTPEVFYACSAGELKAWGLMQDDPELAPAVESLLSLEERAPLVPAHCDLRLDQFLLAGSRMYVADWEEFRLADAARDVGSFAGEWLYRAVTGWAADGAGGTDTLTHEEILRRCTEGIGWASAVISAFWSGYRQARGQFDVGLPGRAAAFAGWHLLDRMLAASRDAVRLSAVQRAAAGIGRTILLAPDEAAATIGLGRAR